MTRWGEIKCPRCAELETQIAAMEEGLTAVHMAGYLDGKKAAEARKSNACVSCGAPTPHDFCGFCLEEE